MQTNQNQNPSMLERLRNMSPSAKSRLIMAVVAVAVVGLGAVWSATLKRELSGIENISLDNPLGSVLSATTYITIESTEVRDGKRRIHFKATNDTEDILNFSTLENIQFKVDGQVIKPESLTDRQNGPFVSKVLSKSTVFGTLVFPEFHGTIGTLTFDDMFFERVQGLVFKEDKDLNLETLPPTQELRS